MLQSQASWPAMVLELVPSMFFDEGKDWGRSRRLISPSINGHNMLAVLPMMAKVRGRCRRTNLNSHCYLLGLFFAGCFCDESRSSTDRQNGRSNTTAVCRSSLKMMTHQYNTCSEVDYLLVACRWLQAHRGGELFCKHYSFKARRRRGVEYVQSRRDCIQSRLNVLLADDGAVRMVAVGLPRRWPVKP